MALTKYSGQVDCFSVGGLSGFVAQTLCKHVAKDLQTPCKRPANMLQTSCKHASAQLCYKLNQLCYK